MRRYSAAVLPLILSLFLGMASAQQQAREAERKVVSRVVPTYPEIARKMQLRGVVRIQALVMANGKVKSTVVVGGSPLLAKAGADAIEKWKWEPTAQESKELIQLNFDPSQ
jgi:TonB family protein